MMLPIENNDTFLLYFHDLDGSDKTSYYTCINREPKYCLNVDYRKDFKQIFSDFDKLISDKIKQYPKVVLAGDGLGGWFANHFAHKYKLRALLIDPCIYPKGALASDIPQIEDLKLSFPTSNRKDMSLLIENDDKKPSVEMAKRTLVNLPRSWTVEYLKVGLPRIEDDIYLSLNTLCDAPFIWIDTATLYGEDD